MTNQPSVRLLPEFCPPTELIRNWETMYKQAGNNPDAVLRNVAWETAQWGADQQLMQDATWLDLNSLDTPHLKITPIGKTLIEAWGADQQLTKDATWLDHNSLDTPHLKITPIGKTLIEAMRPKPPSLKQQAFEALSIAVVENEETFSPAVKRLICKALEELPND